MDVQVSCERDAADEEEKSIQRINCQRQHRMADQAFRDGHSGQVEQGEHCKH